MGLARPWLVAALAGLLLTVPAHAQIHTPHDHIPDFCASPTISSAGSGAWSSPGTWSPARVPLTTDRVAVAAGTVVTFDVQHGAAIRCVGIHGELRFDPASDTRLWAGEVLVYAGGHLQIGTAAQPLPAARRAEIVIANKALDPVADPDQYGTGLVAWGKVTIHGAAKQPTFVRTASEPRAGHTVLQLERPATGWRPGDRLFIPDSRQVDENNKFNPGYVLHIDEVTVQSMSGDGRSVTVSPALQYDHRGARDADSTPTVLSDGTRLLPHVGNLTRNVVIRSENPRRHPGPYPVHAPRRRADPLRAVPGPRAHAGRAAPRGHQPHRPLPAPRAPRLGPGQPVEHRLPVRARRQRGQRQLEVAHRRPRQPHIAGGRAPCTDTTTHPEIDGITCPLTEGPGPIPRPPSGLVIR